MKQQADVVFDTLLDFYIKNAMAFYKRNIGKRGHLERTEGLHMAIICSNMGELYWGRGNQSEALKYFEQAVFVGRLAAPDSLVVAMAFSNMGDIYQNQGRLDDALRSKQEAVLIEERLIPSSQAVSMSYETIGNILTCQGKSKEAMAAFGKARGFAYGMKH